MKYCPNCANPLQSSLTSCVCGCGIAPSPAAVTVNREAIEDIIEKAQVKVGYDGAWVRDPEEVAEQIIATLTPAPVAGWRDMESAPKDDDEEIDVSTALKETLFTILRETTAYDRKDISYGGVLSDTSGGPKLAYLKLSFELPPAPGQPATEGPEAVQEAINQIKPDAVRALASYQQADQEGIMVLVSRQAIEECLPALRALEAPQYSQGKEPASRQQKQRLEAEDRRRLGSSK